jgi:hypothetical protein
MNTGYSNEIDSRYWYGFKHDDDVSLCQKEDFLESEDFDYAVFIKKNHVAVRPSCGMVSCDVWNKPCKNAS